jgi:uncharacterized membrane protein (DUF485 family)
MKLMSHGPSTDWGHDKAAARKTSVGILMFVIYAFVYAAFVIVTTINPNLMEITILGQSLSIVYGLGLIVFALFLALIYNSISNRAETVMNGVQAGEEELS